MSLGVCGDEDQPLIAVERTHLGFADAPAEIVLRVRGVVDRLRATVSESRDRVRLPTQLGTGGRLQRLGRLHLLRSIRYHLPDHLFLTFGRRQLFGGGRRRAEQLLLRIEEERLRQHEMLDDFSHRPSVRSGFERPLRIGQLGALRQHLIAGRRQVQDERGALLVGNLTGGLRRCGQRDAKSRGREEG